MKYDAICLSGGSVRGIAQLGALDWFWKHKKISYETIDYFAGTSVGSCICLLLSMGYTPYEIFEKVCSIDSFFEGSDTIELVSGDNIFTQLNLFSSISSHKGIIRIKKFVSHVSEMVEEKWKKLSQTSGTPTFEQLYNLTGKELYIVASNINTMEEVVFSYKTHPKLSCISAMAASCNLPVLFTENKLFNQTFIDGGFSNNCPLRELKGHTVLTIIVSGSDMIQYEDTFTSYLIRCMLFSILMVQNLKLKEVYNDPDTQFHIVNVPVTNSSVMNFNMSYNEKVEMFSAGYDYAEISQVDRYLFVRL